MHDIDGNVAMNLLAPLYICTAYNYELIYLLYRVNLLLALLLASTSPGDMFHVFEYQV